MDRYQNTRQPDWEWWSVLWDDPKAILESLAIRPGESIADVGAGNGYFTLPGAEIADPATVYAIDIDQELLDELNAATDRRGCSNVRTIQGDARKLHRLLPAPVDVVLLANTFHGIDSPGVFAQQAHESLTPDGRLIVLNWQDQPPEATQVAGSPRGPPHELRTTPEETIERLSTAPFASFQTVAVPPHHYGVICEQ